MAAYRPTFDAPDNYPIGSRRLTKTLGPALAPDAVGPIQAVLLSHDQHPDNLDRLGRDYLSRVSLVLSTGSAAPCARCRTRVTSTCRARTTAADPGAGHAVPLHFEGWAHFTQGADTLVAAFTRSGLADRLHLLTPGEQVTVTRRRGHRPAPPSVLNHTSEPHFGTTVPNHSSGSRAGRSAGRAAGVARSTTPWRPIAWLAWTRAGS